MRITPSARILSVLGDIEFDEWQCVAEFVDNAFDDFSAIHRANLEWDEGFRVDIALPFIGSNEDDQISITDNGRGMTRSGLEQAVRAGWSGNDQYSKLGLFGMGFNIASARLGRKTTVLTTRAGDSSWSGVEIDLGLIQDDFEVPDFDVEKEEPHLHGTFRRINEVRNRVMHPVRETPPEEDDFSFVRSWSEGLRRRAESVVM
jgi:hypothetical protein